MLPGERLGKPHCAIYKGDTLGLTLKTQKTSVRRLLEEQPCTGLKEFHHWPPGWRVRRPTAKFTYMSLRYRCLCAPSYSSPNSPKQTA